jgi:hypothetical protein
MAGTSQNHLIPFRVLVLPTTVLVMAHFLYIYPSIVMDRKKMENAFKKSIAFASRHYWFTFVFLCCYIGTYFLVIHYGGRIGTPKYIFAQLVLIAAQAFFVAGITIAFTKTQRPKHKHRSNEKKTPGAAAGMLPPVEPEENVIDEQRNEHEWYHDENQEFE